MRVAIERWAAWAPGVESEAEWRAWSAAPKALPSEGLADARFIPAMLRRRCTPLTRAMVSAAFRCAPLEELTTLRSVFASRHGSINESIGLLENLARSEKLSPAIFSHTVHNAQAGLFSIAAGNRAASSSLSAQEDTFAAAWIDALCFFERDPTRPVLLVVGDVPLAETFAPLVDEPIVPYALALVLSVAAPGRAASELALAPARTDARRPEWPAALEFLRAWLQGEPELALAGARSTYRFTFARS